jgi:hypothetical protein
MVVIIAAWRCGVHRCGVDGLRHGVEHAPRSGKGASCRGRLLLIGILLRPV